MQAYQNTYNKPQQQHWKVDIEGSLSIEHTERTSQMQETQVWGFTHKECKGESSTIRWENYQSCFQNF